MLAKKKTSKPTKNMSIVINVSVSSVKKSIQGLMLDEIVVFLRQKVNSFRLLILTTGNTPKKSNSPSIDWTQTKNQSQHLSLTLDSTQTGVLRKLEVGLHEKHSCALLGKPQFFGMNLEVLMKSGCPQIQNFWNVQKFGTEKRHLFTCPFQHTSQLTTIIPSLEVDHSQLVGLEYGGHVQNMSPPSVHGMLSCALHQLDYL